MADFSEIISSIEEKIRANGQQAITGDILQDELLGIVDAVNVLKQDTLKNYTYLGYLAPGSVVTVPLGEKVAALLGPGTYTINGDALNIAANTLALATIEEDGTVEHHTILSVPSSPFRAGAGSGSAVLTEGGSLAPGKQAVGVGLQTRANVDCSLVYGAACKADGNRGHAGGFWSQAPGENAVALGDHVEANSKDEAAFGRYNRHNPDLYNLLFSVGMGTSADRRNAVQIDDDGKMYVRGVGCYDGGVVRDDGTVGMSLQDLLCCKLEGQQMPGLGAESWTEKAAERAEQALAGVFQDYGMVFPRIPLRDVLHYPFIRSALETTITNMRGNHALTEYYAAFGYLEHIGSDPDDEECAADVYVIWHDPDLDGYFGMLIEV